MASRPYFARYLYIDQTGNINRPWLTIIMDDYSRALQDTL